MSKKEEHSDEMRKISRTSMKWIAALHPPVFIHSLPPSSSIHRTMGWKVLEKFKKRNINFNPAWC